MTESVYAQREAFRRLLGREQGSRLKDPGGRLAVAIVYPNSYRVGMSNLGFHQLYRLLNRYGDTFAERFFYMGPGREVASVEQFRRLDEFDLVLFSISYELDYLNIPRLLNAAGIPPLASNRGEGFPLIIAGGACIMANPAPVASYFDALAIGEAEVLLRPALEAVIDAGGSSKDRLKSLAGVSGMMVPGYTHEPVKRRYLENLDEEPCHTAVVAPDAEFGHMYMLEVERGCGRNCRFCMVNRVFSPLRFRSLAGLLGAAEEGLEHCKTIGLVGPVVSAHPQAEELVRGIAGMGGRVAISSLAVKPVSEGLFNALVAAGANSITLAPEAGSFQLRKNIGKQISGAEILEAVAKAYSAGFKALKLYFMAGLPGEQEEDIIALKDLVVECGSIYRRRSLSINIAPFVPKPFTDFEREPMAPLELIEKRFEYLKKELAGRKVHVKLESPAWSRVQAVLSRGDGRLAPVMASLARPTLTAWRRGLEAAGIHDEEYLGSIPEGGELPWRKLVEQ